MNISDLTYAVHPIDITNGSVERRRIPDAADLETFVKQLVNSPALANENRRFAWPTASALVPALLKNMASNPDEFDDATQVMAERLHQKELEAQKQVEHMDVQVQKGSLIQMTFNGDGMRQALLVKVHLAPFLDEAKYKRQDGYPLENAVLKMCLIEFDDSGNPNNVSVADSNARLATFWWKEFLELTELTTDEFNTRTALNAMHGLLVRKLKKDHRADFYQLNNNLIGYFRTRRHYNHARMLDYVFGDYRPIDRNLSLGPVIDLAKALPSKNKYDQRFGIDESSVDKRRRTVIPLTEQISLEIKDSIENLPDTIHSGVLDDGTQGVFVRTEDGYKYFLTPDAPTNVRKASR